jgi:hypothetical protein
MPTPQKAGNSPEMHIRPSLIPNASEDVFTTDIRLTEIHVINISDSPVKVTIYDKQDTPLPVIPPEFTVDPKGEETWEFSGRYCPGGVTWVASVPDVIVGYMRGRE